MRVLDLYVRILRKRGVILASYLISFLIMIMVFSTSRFPGLVGQKGVQQYYQYAVLAVLCLTALGVSAFTSATFRADLVMRHQIAPIHMRFLILRYLTADILWMLFVYFMCVWVGVVLYGEQIYYIRGLLYNINLLAAALIGLAVGIFNGAFFKTLQARLTSINTLILVLAFMGGTFPILPIDNENILIASSFTPLFWYQKAIKEIVYLQNNKSNNYQTFLCCVGVQLIFAAAILVMGLMVVKQRGGEEY